MHSEVHAQMQPWSLPMTLVLGGIAVVYLCIWRRLPTLRVAAFIGGLFSVWLAVASPLAALDHQLLTIHMVKHLLLMLVASPLILFGLPTYQSASIFRHLVWCWLAGTATVVGWHIPAAFQLALGSHWWHGVEQTSFLLAGLLFWWPVIQSRPSQGQEWSVPLYLFLATLPCDILSAFLVFCGRVVYPSYLEVPRLFHLSSLQDQEFAGALMWVSVTLIYVIPAVIITVQILSPTIQAEAKAVQS